MKKNPINLQSKLVQFLTLAVITILWFICEENTNVNYAAFPVMLALGIAQMGMSAYDKFQADAEVDALNTRLKTAADDLEDIKYTNALKAVSVPKNQVALDNLGQQTTQVVDAAQEGGQRGVLGSVGRVRQLFDKGTMAVSQADQMRLDQRDLAVAENQQNVDNMNTNLQAQIGMQEIYGLQGALGYQSARGNNAMNNFYSGLGTTIAGVGQLNTPTKSVDATVVDETVTNPINKTVAQDTSRTGFVNITGARGNDQTYDIARNPQMNYNDYLQQNGLTESDISFGEYQQQIALGLPGMRGSNVMNPFYNPIMNLPNIPQQNIPQQMTAFDMLQYVNQ